MMKVPIRIKYYDNWVKAPLVLSAIFAVSGWGSWIYNYLMIDSLKISYELYSEKLNSYLVVGIIGTIIFLICRYFNYRIEVKNEIGIWDIPEVDIKIENIIDEIVVLANDSAIKERIMQEISHVNNRVIRHNYVLELKEKMKWNQYAEKLAMNLPIKVGLDFLTKISRCKTSLEMIETILDIESKYNEDVFDEHKAAEKNHEEEKHSEEIHSDEIPSDDINYLESIYTENDKYNETDIIRDFDFNKWESDFTKEWDECRFKINKKINKEINKETKRNNTNKSYTNKSNSNKINYTKSTASNYDVHCQYYNEDSIPLCKYWGWIDPLCTFCEVFDEFRVLNGKETNGSSEAELYYQGTSEESEYDWSDYGYRMMDSIEDEQIDS